MKVHNITSNNLSITTTSSKSLSKELKSYLDNYSRENFTHSNPQEQQSKHSNLLNHQDLFRFEINEDEYVSKVYLDDQEVKQTVRNMLMSNSTNDLLSTYDLLVDDGRLTFGIHQEDSAGDISFDRDNIQNCEIFITTDQPILGVVTTVIHELTHFNDLNKISQQSLQSTNSYELEVNAFSKEYEYLLENNYTLDTSFISLSNLEKDIYQNAYTLKNENNLSKKSFMIELLENIGYEKDSLLERKLVSNKNIELNRQVATSELHTMVMKNKINND